MRVAAKTGVEPMNMQSHYFFFRVLNQARKLNWGFEKLPASEYRGARLALEKKEHCVVISLYRMPGILIPVLDLLASIVRRPLPYPVLADFLHNLGLMLKSGIPIDTALSELSRESENRKVAGMAKTLHDSVRSGNSLSFSLEKFAHLMPVSVRSLVEIGEKSGNLDQVLTEAAKHLNRLNLIKQDVTRALIYPAFVMMTVLGAALFWVYYVLPDLSKMFHQMGSQLPAITLNVMMGVNWIKDFLVNWGIEFFLGLALLVMIAARSERVQMLFFSLAYRLPVSRIIVRSSAMAFITEYLSMLISSGISIIDSLKILEKAVSNRLYQQRIRQVREGIVRGNVLSKELARAEVFPPMVIRLINVGELSGNLDKQLNILSQEYRRRLEHVIGTISEVLKPLVILVAGAFFIFVVIIFLLPVYQLIAKAALR
jgi:type II secretory pathway component PulF